MRLEEAWLDTPTSGVTSVARLNCNAARTPALYSLLDSHQCDLKGCVYIDYWYMFTVQWLQNE